MKAAVISMGSVSSKWIAESMKKYFDKVDHLRIRDLEVGLGGKKAEVLYQGNPLENYDCIYARGSSHYANLIRAIATLTSQICYLPIPADAYTIGHDKILTHMTLQSSRISMPKTYLVATINSGKKVLKKVQYPVVIKLPSGTHGKGVMLADSYESASSLIDALVVLKQPFLIQEYIETDGTDIRVLVAGDEVIGAMKRIAVQGEKRANIHAGGIGKLVQITDKTKKLAISAAKALKCDLCAVDILESDQGPLVIEVNLSPGIQGLTKATNINVADNIAKFLHDRTKLMCDLKAGKKTEELMKEIIEGEKEIITQLDVKNDKIIIPSLMKKISEFEEGDDVVIKAKKGKVCLERFK